MMAIVGNRAPKPPLAGVVVEGAAGAAGLLGRMFGEGAEDVQACFSEGWPVATPQELLSVQVRVCLLSIVQAFQLPQFQFGVHVAGGCVVLLTVGVLGATYVQVWLSDGLPVVTPQELASEHVRACVPSLAHVFHAPQLHEGVQPEDKLPPDEPPEPPEPPLPEPPSLRVTV